jgi:hypothetical protein
VHPSTVQPLSGQVTAQDAESEQSTLHAVLSEHSTAQLSTPVQSTSQVPSPHWAAQLSVAVQSMSQESALQAQDSLSTQTHAPSASQTPSTSPSSEVPEQAANKSERASRNFDMGVSS